MPLFWIALNSVKGLGPVRIRSLLEACGTPEAVFKEKKSTLAKIPGISDESLTMLRDPRLFEFAENQVTRAKDQRITILTLADPGYPALLKEIFAPPPVLYVKGQSSVFSRRSVAIVGTRRPTPYGRQAAEQLAAGLVERGLAIISGLAAGIDSIAHQVCLDKKGSTAAVLGCGVDQVYPASNKPLAERIEKTGALVSEFPLGTEPESFNFPRRNRIISGLSAGVVVIEAGQRSGALITAHYALQQDRDVFAVPGSIFSEKSIGTFNLIKNGAVPVRTAADIAGSLNCTEQKALELFPTPVTSMPLHLLTEAERSVFEVLSDTPQRVDTIAQKTTRSAADLLIVLLNLELKGMIRQLAGQQFVRL